MRIKILTLLLVLIAVPISGQTYIVKKYVVGSSAQTVQNFEIKIKSTLGQSIVGKTENATNTVSSGFWHGVETTPVVTQTIALKAGWNMLSAYVNPLRNEIDSVVSSISQNLVLLIDKNQLQYVPGENSTLTNWNNEMAYHLYLQNDDTIRIKGYVIDPREFVISLAVGWNLTPYLNNAPAPFGVALSSIIDKVLLIKSSDEIFFPTFDVLSITEMSPGKAYWVYVTEPCLLIYPSNGD